MMIGVFDSGHGGLTVLNALVARFPEHSFVYLGDHAQAPYGLREPAEILARTQMSVDWLFQRGCRLVLLACNTASAVALRPLQQDWLTTQAPERRVLGVLVPLVEALSGVSWQDEASDRRSGPARTVGLLATPNTVESQCFPREVQLRAPEIKVIQQACPALVPRIEAGTDRARLDGLVRGYLQALLQKAVPQRLDSVVLACTHYQLVADLFANALPPEIRLVRQPELVAESLARYLKRHPRLVVPTPKEPPARFFTTGDPETVAESAERLFMRPPRFQVATGFGSAARHAVSALAGAPL